jgi:hypothetical protein
MVYGKFIGTLILIGGLGLAGGVLYLPFLLWFRRRRRRTRAITVETRITRAGVLFAALPVGVLFGGFAAGAVAPQSLLGSLTEGIGGVLIWGLFTVLFPTARRQSNMSSDKCRQELFVVLQSTGGVRPHLVSHQRLL